MVSRSFGAEPETRAPARSRQSTATRTHRKRENESVITDPRLIMIVRRANGAMKRAFDVFASASALIALFPAFATVALLIWLTDRGPALYTHTRVGRYGRPFKVWKFRSMIVNSDKVLADLLANDPAAAAEWREAQKLTNDPRVTRIGAFLRKTSIDELPQLWNVLMGEMSIVGPRPITRPELDRYGKERRYYLLVRPGITGLWQVSGRSQTTYDKRIKYDRDYVEQWSFQRDLEIILRTIPAVLASRGAY